MIPQETTQALQAAAKAAQETKAIDIRAYDIVELNPLIGATLIASGDNPRQVLAIAQNIEKAVNEKAHIKPRSREGLDTADWVLLDYGDFVVHVMNEQARVFYDLESLWRNCPSIDL